jgi:alkanesulfonate monooxygenase SsuD/methylene tetrahydromethanopterin reductase-like flavin-dependent oxidoreductase (luciferase family)
MSKNDDLDLKFGVKIPFSPLDKIYETASLAEKLNFDSIWSPDHLTGLNPHDRSAYSVWCLLSTIARETQSCMLGTSVTDCVRLNVAVLAQTCMTIQEISRGRFILGIGCGEAQNTLPYGINYDRKIKRLEEFIIGLRSLWSEEEVNFEGEFVKLSGAAVSPFPSKTIPIWIGANSPKTIELTARIADGWLPLAIKFSPSDYVSTLKIMQKSIKSKDSFEPALFVHTLAEKNGDQVWKKISEMGKLLLVMWIPEIFNKYGIVIPNEFRATQLDYTKPKLQRLCELLNTLPDEPLYERFVAGTPDDCIEKIEEYTKAGVKHFVLSFLSPASMITESIKYYSEKVVNYFRG